MKALERPVMIPEDLFHARGDGRQPDACAAEVIFR